MVDLFDVHMGKMALREKQLNRKGIKIFKLSTTERQEFKECRRRWDYSSLSRRGLEPKRPAIALWFGTGIHYVLEHFYNGVQSEAHGYSVKECLSIWDAWCKEEIQRIEESQNNLWDEQRAEIDSTIELGKQMLENYVLWASTADLKSQKGFKEILYTEREFAVAVKDSETGKEFWFTDSSGQVWEIWLVGRLDMVIKDFQGKYWVLDHKTSKDRLDPENLILDDQMTMYLWAAQEILQVPLEGCLYNVLRKKVPTIPKVLVNGLGLSKSKSIDTTPEVYLKAILDNNFDPGDYEDILELLNNKNTGFFEREKVYRNQHEISMAGRMLLMESIDMLNAPYIYPNPTWDCKWKCDYKVLCLATNRNDDVDFLERGLFQKRVVEEDSSYNRESTIK